MTARDRLAIWFAVGQCRARLAWVASAAPDIGAMKVAHLRNQLGWIRNCLADFLLDGLP